MIASFIEAFTLSFIEDRGCIISESQDIWLDGSMVANSKGFTEELSEANKFLVEL